MSANFLLKLSLDQEIRRVRCPENEKLSIEWLNNKTRETFPDFRAHQLCFLYTDDENDEVTIKTQSDLEEALLFSQETGKKHLKLSVQRARMMKQGGCRRKNVHQGITCDGCQKAIGDGLRFKCLGCPDFDFCESCEQDEEKRRNHGKNHIFMRVSKPISLPPLMTLLNPEQIQVYGVPGTPHFGVVCDGCKKNITGTRYKCAACCDFDFCASCVEDASDLHPENHPFMKITAPCRLGLNGGSVICEARKDMFLSPEIAAVDIPFRRRCHRGWRHGGCPRTHCGEKVESTQQTQQTPQTQQTQQQKAEEAFCADFQRALGLATALAQEQQEQHFQQQKEQQKEQEQKTPQVEAVPAQTTETPMEDVVEEPLESQVDRTETSSENEQPKETKAVDPRELRFKEQLNDLEAMGFCDRQANLAALDKVKGNLQRAVDLLLTGW